MSTNRKVFFLLLTLGAILIAPNVTYYLTGNSPQQIQFPPLQPHPKAGFNWVVTIIISLLFVSTLLLLLVPRVYGFKKMPPDDQVVNSKTRLPLWFWIGLVLWLGPLISLCMKSAEPKWLLDWAVLPLFWGFTLVLDGWVYARNDGKSLVSTASRELIGIGVVSISGWLIFEYLNFFIRINWYYPKATLVNHGEFLLYALLGSSGLMPMAFEWFTLLRTFRLWKYKYRLGPKFQVPNKVKIVLVVLSFIGLIVAVIAPDRLFYVLWLGPLIILTIVLEWLGLWTPFIPVRKGDWNALLLFALTYLIQGLLLECWNYLSGNYINGTLQSYNPAYWAYSVPYVDFLHVFEMPILGYLGYIPFGVYCWIWWITFSYILDIPTGYTVQEDLIAA